jgi:hypothetical protein
MTRDDFKALPEWEKIARTAGEWITEARMLALANVQTGNVDAIATMTAYQAGVVDGITRMLNAPEQLLLNGQAPKETKEPEGTLALPRHPRTTEHAY